MPVRPAGTAPARGPFFCTRHLVEQRANRRPATTRYRHHRSARPAGAMRVTRWRGTSRRAHRSGCASGHRHRLLRRPGRDRADVRLRRARVSPRSARLDRPGPKTAVHAGRQTLPRSGAARHGRTSPQAPGTRALVTGGCCAWTMNSWPALSSARGRPLPSCPLPGLLGCQRHSRQTPILACHTVHRWSLNATWC